jgi:hypothetical protein
MARKKKSISKKKPSTKKKEVADPAIDRARFLAAYEDETDDEYPDEVPATLEGLFDGLHDPDDFSAETAAVLRAALAAVKRRDTELAEDPRISMVTVYPGNVRARSSFTFDTHVLVLGDLEVEHAIIANPAHAILMVAGSIRCAAMQLVRGYLYVTGDLFARDCFLGTTAGLSKVGGRIETRAYLQDKSWLNLALDDDGEPNLDNVLAPLQLDVDAPDARARFAQVLIPGALGQEGPDFGNGRAALHELFDRLAGGEWLFRHT